MIKFLLLSVTTLLILIFLERTFISYRISNLFTILIILNVVFTIFIGVLATITQLE